MLIDFHTHIFPDAIAHRAITELEQRAGIPAYTDGTLSGLKSSMKRAGIDMSVVLPVATKPSQFDTINSFAAKLNSVEASKGIISFGGIHPDCDECEDKLNHIKKLSLKGIKLHPDYQQCYIDDEKYIRIISHCVKLGLIVIIHSGVDAGYPYPVHCTPDRAAKMLDEVEKLCPDCEAKIVLAHLGANEMSDGVLSELVGRNVYFDLAYVLSHEQPRIISEVIKAHGASKILFASDTPWSNQENDVKTFAKLDLTDDEREMISHLNAEKLLGL